MVGFAMLYFVLFRGGPARLSVLYFLVEFPTTRETDMKRSRFSEDQIIAILRAGERLADEGGVSATWFQLGDVL